MLYGRNVLSETWKRSSKLFAMTFKFIKVKWYFTTLWVLPILLLQLIIINALVYYLGVCLLLLKRYLLDSFEKELLSLILNGPFFRCSRPLLRLLRRIYFGVVVIILYVLNWIAKFHDDSSESQHHNDWSKNDGES